MHLELPDRLLKRLNPSDVRRYAVQSGWIPVDGIKRPVILLNHPTDETIQIQIPREGNEREVSYLMNDALLRLAEMEKRSPREVLNDILLGPADRLRLSVQSADADSGSLPMGDALKLFEGGYNILLAGACSAHHPQAFYPRQAFAQAQEFIRRCRLGQTEWNSYSATIIAPVPPQLSPSLFENQDEGEEIVEQPYERRVTLLVMRGLQTIHAAIERGKAAEILGGVAQGVSANLCDALASIGLGDTHGRLKITMNWSRTRPQVPQNTLSDVTFRENDFVLIREAARMLREAFNTRRERIEGLILGLQAEPAQLFADFQGKVTIRALVDGRSVRVRFVLNQEDYAVACDAHRDGRRVAVVGDLQKAIQAKQFELSDPQDFKMLP
jgi:hypothetical protein